MDTSTITLLVSGFTIIWLVVGILYALLKGIPIANDTLVELARLIMTITQPIRDMFNKNTKLAKALESTGVPREVADQIAEFGADILEEMAKPYLIEATPKAEQ